VGAGFPGGVPKPDKLDNVVLVINDVDDPIYVVLANLNSFARYGGPVSWNQLNEFGVLPMR